MKAKHILFPRKSDSIEKDWEEAVSRRQVRFFDAEWNRVRAPRTYAAEWFDEAERGGEPVWRGYL